jgi:hypothetical protein
MDKVVKTEKKAEKSEMEFDPKVLERVLSPRPVDLANFSEALGERREDSVPKKNPA